MLFLPIPCVADAYITDFLQTQPFFMHWYGHPEGSLVIFKPVPGDPGCPAGKLDIIQDNKIVRKLGFKKITGIWRKIRLVGGYDHDDTPAILTNGDRTFREKPYVSHHIIIKAAV
jgi:hypothetical protein